MISLTLIPEGVGACGSPRFSVMAPLLPQRGLEVYQTPDVRQGDRPDRFLHRTYAFPSPAPTSPRLSSAADFIRLLKRVQMQGGAPQAE
jgi:hypothetical protein